MLYQIDEMDFFSYTGSLHHPFALTLRYTRLKKTSQYSQFNTILLIYVLYNVFVTLGDI